MTNNEKKRLLVITEKCPELGQSEIVKFAAGYSYERHRIQAAFYINLGSNKGRARDIDMLDKLNLDLNLEVYSQSNPHKYCDAVCKKIMQKYKDAFIVLIFDNVNESVDQQGILVIVK